MLKRLRKRLSNFPKLCLNTETQGHRDTGTQRDDVRKAECVIV